jgi:3-dehydroquinate synthase
MDEKEQGVRAWLNLGHTFGHAIERCLGYGVLLHGEAVAIGMAMAADYAAKDGLLATQQAERIKAVIKLFGLPITLNGYEDKVTAADLTQAMALDKKNVDADLTLILPKAIGEVTIKHSVKSQDVKHFLERYI